MLLVAIGIGATTATYSVLDAALFRPLPYPAPQQLVTAENVDLPYDFGRSMPKVRAYASDLGDVGVFSAVATHAIGALNLGVDGAAVRVSAAYVTHDFFRTLGRAPRLGRAFSPDEGTSTGDSHVAVLSNRLWMQEFAGSSTALGRPLTLNGRQFRVIGVMPPDFAYPSDPDLWLPLPLPISNPEIFEAFGMFIPMTTVARLRPGVSVSTANAGVARVEREYRTWSFMTDSAARDLVQPLQASLLGASARRPLIALGASAGLVLLLSCANLAALLATRSVDRQQELELRMVLGASRTHLLMQPIAEVVLLSVAGAVGGILIATASMRPLAALLPPNLLTVAPPALNVRLLGFAIVLSLAVAGAVALAFAASVGRATAHAVGIGSGRATARGSIAREAIGAAQVALALVLVVAAALMLDSLHRLTSVDTGLHPEDVAVARVTLPRASYPTPDKAALFVQNTLTRLAAVPGIDAAGAVDVLPMAGRTGFGVVLTTIAQPADSLMPLTYSVTPGYFASMGIPLLSGRDFRWTDRSGDALLLNAATARQIADGAVVGRQVIVDGRPRTVIGVVGNVRTKRLGDTAVAQMYMPFAEAGGNTANIVVKSSMPLSAIGPRIREAVRTSDQTIPVYGILPMESVIAASVAGPRAAGALLAVFSAIALILAGIGVYGVTAHNVGARRREFAIRLAVGADPFELLLRALRRAAIFAAVGIASGIVIAMATTRLIAHLLFGVSPLSFAVFSVAGAVLFATALIGALGPALRGSRADPGKSLRLD